MLCITSPIYANILRALYMYFIMKHHYNDSVLQSTFKYNSDFYYIFFNFCTLHKYNEIIFNVIDKNISNEITVVISIGYSRSYTYAEPSLVSVIYSKEKGFARAGKSRNLSTLSHGKLASGLQRCATMLATKSRIQLLNNIPAMPIV